MGGGGGVIINIFGPWSAVLLELLELCVMTMSKVLLSYEVYTAECIGSA